MPNLDSALGVHEYALGLHSRRLEMLAANLANADTPNYKAQDIDFKTALRQYQEQMNGGGLQVTNARHLGGNTGSSPEPMYRVPMQPSLDGNTVDSQVEKAAFMENALHYQATVTFLDGSISTLRKAIRGD